MLVLRLCCIALLALAGMLAPAHAAAVRVDRAFASAPLTPYLDLYVDESAALDFDEVRSRAGFQAIGARNPNFGFSRAAIWVRLDIENDDDRAHDLVLRQDYPLIDYLDAWIEDERGVYVQTSTGDRRPFSTRSVAHRDFLFTLSVPANATRTVYLRFATAGSLNLGLHLYTQEAMLETLSTEQLAYGFYYGGFGVLLLYNLFIFLAVRDRAFFYYLAYALSYGLYFGVHNGLSFQFLWPDSPDWGNRALVVLLALSLLFALKFARHFLDTPNHSKRLDVVARVFEALCVAGFVAGFALPYKQTIVPMAAHTVLVVSLMLTLGFTALGQGYRPARYFLLAWVALLFGVLAYMFKTFGLLPHNAATQNGFQAGALLEMVLLSLALAARVTELKRQTMTDPLTQLANRRFFDRQLELAVAQTDRGGVALLVLDIDHFKQFNDRFGHATGDQVLSTVGRVLAASVPRGATVCRYGGEEFTVILPTMDVAEAAKVGEALRAAVEATPFEHGRITISIGVAFADGRRYASPQDLFAAADKALYEAKRLGRNRVELADGGVAPS